jgi:D-serine deaminase-like pyridoxal phosphate-dependent protein
VRVADLPTPCLVVDTATLEQNIATMGEAWPGRTLRPHVKAFKSTAMARHLAAAGHDALCGATARELLGLAGAGLGEDLLLANELVDPRRLAALAACGARVTVAVDSGETVDAAARAGIREVLVDVDVGCIRCGAAPDDAPRVAERARRAGLEVRGVMGYEGHLMMAPPEEKAQKVAEAMAVLARVHEQVGGEVVSGGGTGTAAVNRWVTELQAGSYTLMDADYGRAGLPFRQALHLLTTVISRNPGGWAVSDGGLKALGMDHGNPVMDGYRLLFCSDEHTTFMAEEGGTLPAVGERVRITPSHVDPTVAYHEWLYLASGEDVVDRWEVDLRNW